MSAPETPEAGHGPITQPFDVEPTHVVEAVYSRTDAEGRLVDQGGVELGVMEPEVADVASHVDFTEYAFERVTPPRRRHTTDVVTATIPTTESRRVLGEGYVLGISPRVSATFFLASTLVGNALLNGPSALADLKEALAPAGQKVHNLIFGEPAQLAHIDRTVVPGTEIVLDETYPQPVGESAANSADVAKLIQEIKDAQTEHDATLTKITVIAGSSDEWGPDERTLTVPNPGNHDIDSRRGQDAAAEIRRQAAEAGLEIPEIEVVSFEDLLSTQEVSQLRDLADAHDLSLNQAIAIYNRGGNLPADLQALLQEKLGDARAVHIQVHLQTPDQVFTSVHDRTVEQAPVNEDHDYCPFIGLPLPWRRRRVEELYPGMKVVSWVRPRIEADQRWIELYKEAINEDGTLAPMAAMLTRKYQWLARDDRIQQVLTHRYTDATGEDRELRVLFVDHTPSDEVVEGFISLLSNVAQLKDGRVPIHLDMISVFPSEQVGIDPTPGRKDGLHDPKQVGIGIDTQNVTALHGVAVPQLRLVEMHMSAKTTAAELYHYAGGLFTAAHEVAGHFTAVAGEDPIRVEPVGPAYMRHYVAANLEWEDPARAAVEGLAGVRARGPHNFTVDWHAATSEGDVSPAMTDHVTYPSPLLGVATSARLDGRLPTRYAGKSTDEAYADTAASLTAGIPIPYDEAGLDVQPRHPALGRGYMPDQALQQAFIDHTGWDPSAEHPEVVGDFTLTHPNDDPVLGPIFEKARRTAMPGDRVTLLVDESNHEEDY